MMFRRTALGLLAAAFCSVALAGAAAAEERSGTVRITSTSIALGIGVTWGDGELTYKGEVYKFSVRGLSVLDLGVSSVTAVGPVFDLKKLEDFNGNYFAGQAGAAVGGGASASRMQNQNGVVISLTATQTGAKLTLAAEGVQIELK